MDDGAPSPAVVRREPPRFRPVEVVGVLDLTPRLRRLTFGGPALEGLPAGLPAASVRLLLPRGASGELPRWQGNEFRWEDGSRPTIRTLTPRRVATDHGREPELDVDVVLHGTGALSSWAAAVAPGARAAVAGTGRGYELDPDAEVLVMAGDETALGALGVLLEAAPDTEVRVLVEAADAAARFDLPAHPRAEVAWHALGGGAPPGSAMLAAIRGLDVPPSARWWVAGEAAGVQRIRRHLADERGVPRDRTVVRGYWKHGRAATGAGG
jgi:NADPH-dependent ferric siderophore reductase